jgi:cytochrome b561
MRSPAVTRFDAVTLWLHWITAVLVLVQFGAALSLAHIDPSQVDLVLSVHRSTGLALWVLVVARLIWRSTYMTAPPLPASTPRLQRLAARSTEYALYVLLLVQPATGLADTLFRAHPFPVFGLSVPVLVGKSKLIYKAAHGLHEAGAWLLAGLIGLHTAAALFHRLVLKDAVLQSMLPRRKVSLEANTPPDPSNPPADPPGVIRAEGGPTPAADALGEATVDDT